MPAVPKLGFANPFGYSENSKGFAKNFLKHGFPYVLLVIFVLGVRQFLIFDFRGSRSKKFGNPCSKLKKHSELFCVCEVRITTLIKFWHFMNPKFWKKMRYLVIRTLSILIKA